MENKISQECRVCHRVLPITDFNPVKRERGWYRKACKECENARHRDWWDRNPDHAKAIASRQYEQRKEILSSPIMRRKINERVRERVVWLREQVYAGYGGRCQCPKCPETDPRFLTVDHVNNDGHLERNRGHSVRRGGQGADLYRKLVRDGFPTIFQLLCFNCNLGKARNHGVCPHCDELKVKESEL